MHIYRASVFILSSRIIPYLEQLMRGFLWGHGHMCKGKSKVAWKVVYLHRQEGGLGIRILDSFNSALITSHIWSIIYCKESLWVKWIHVYKLRDHHFWNVPCHGNMSWSWRNILQVHPLFANLYSISEEMDLRQQLGLILGVRWALSRLLFPLVIFIMLVLILHLLPEISFHSMDGLGLMTGWFVVLRLVPY